MNLADATAVLGGEDSAGGAGWAVEGAGDVDGDGALDLLIGAPTQSNGRADAGAVYVVCGPVSGSVSLRRSEGRLLGGNQDDYAGYAIAGGDIDGDGLSDVIAGAWGADTTGSAAGEAYLFHGGRR
jgi:hypothetical protein